MTGAVGLRLRREGPGHALGKRAAELALGLVLTIGSLMLWLGIPAGWLWVLSRTGSNYFRIYLETLAVAPPTMIAWGWCLYRINRTYLFIKQSEAHSQPGNPHALLETCMTLSVLVAIVALLAWIVFLGPSSHLPAQGAW